MLAAERDGSPTTATTNKNDTTSTITVIISLKHDCYACQSDNVLWLFESARNRNVKIGDLVGGAKSRSRSINSFKFIDQSN